MTEAADDAPDLSRDTALKRSFRSFTEWMFDQKKPTPRKEQPWWSPLSKFDGWFFEPIVVPAKEFTFLFSEFLALLAA